MSSDNGNDKGDMLAHACEALNVNTTLCKGETASAGQLEELIHNKQLGLDLCAVHETDTEALNALCKAYHIYESYTEHADRKAESDELEHLAHAAAVEKMLIKKEMARRHHLLSKISAAYGIRKHVIAKREHSPSDSDLYTIKTGQEAAETLGKMQDLQHWLLRAYSIHHALTKSDNKRLEEDELEHLVKAAELEKILIDREEASLASAATLLNFN